jgi:phosphatidyl-myo-inositol alpha-mannosyltransferase
MTCPAALWSVQAIVRSAALASPSEVKVAIVSDYYYPQLGGITEHVHGQATELARRGHEVTVVTPRLVVTPTTVDGADIPERTFDLANVGHAFPFYVNGSETLVTLGPGLPFALGRELRRRSFDVVHVHNPLGVMLPISAVMRSNAPVTVGTFHSVVPEGYRLLRTTSRSFERVFRRLDASIAVSAAVVESLSHYFPARRFTTIPNGIDTGFFSPAAEGVRELHGRRTIVFVGRFDPRNGVKHMIGAFAALRRTREDVQLVIVGDGPLRSLVQRMVPRELRDDVVFAGRVNRLRPRYLASAEILCTPCSLASFGMVVLEGMSAGLPVVASRLPGFELVMRDGMDGLMVDRADDEEGFAAALDQLLDDPEMGRRMGAAGRRRAVSTFSWPVVVDAIEALYEALLGRESQPTLRPKAA